jgi:hypothetical protein
MMARHNILATIVVYLDSGQKLTIGDRARLESDYVVRTLFDDLTPKEISAFLEGQILPRMAQQGKVCGVICKPNANTIVGMYYHDDRDIVQRFHFSKGLDAEVRELWNS